MELENSQSKEELKGIGGWLILVAIGVILRPLLLLFATGLSIYMLTGERLITLTTAGTGSYHPLRVPSLIYELVTNIGFLIFCLLQVYTFFKKKACFPRMIITYFITYSLNLVIINFLLSSISTENNFAGIYSFISFGIWSTYFIKSQRVKNTFIN